MNPKNPTTNDNGTNEPYSPPPIIEHQSWPKRFSIKKIMPYLIVSPILINIIPGYIGRLYPPYRAYASFVQDTFNVIFVILFVIIVFIQVKDGGNAKN